MEVLSDFNKVYISGFSFSGMFPCMLAPGQQALRHSGSLCLCLCVCVSLRTWSAAVVTRCIQ